MKIKHKSLIMQKYLKPNALKISQSESQLIFKLRCRVTDVKVNMNGIYDTYECNLYKKRGRKSRTYEHARGFKENKEIKKRILNKK